MEAKEREKERERDLEKHREGIDRAKRARHKDAVACMALRKRKRQTLDWRHSNLPSGSELVRVLKVYLSLSLSRFCPPCAKSP